MTDFVYALTAEEGTTEYTVDRIKFGDGYMQRYPTGLNNGLRKWSVEIADLAKVDADAVDAFFRSRKGVTSFTFRPTGDTVDVRVICPSHTKPIANRFRGGSFAYTIRAEFEEVPV